MINKQMHNPLNKSLKSYINIKMQETIISCVKEMIKIHMKRETIKGEATKRREEVEVSVRRKS